MLWLIDSYRCVVFMSLCIQNNSLNTSCENFDIFPVSTRTFLIFMKTAFYA